MRAGSATVVGLLNGPASDSSTRNAAKRRSLPTEHRKRVVVVDLRGELGLLRLGALVVLVAGDDLLALLLGGGDVAEGDLGLLAGHAPSALAGAAAVEAFVTVGRAGDAMDGRARGQGAAARCARVARVDRIR